MPAHGPGPFPPRPAGSPGSWRRRTDATASPPRTAAEMGRGAGMR